MKKIIKGILEVGERDGSGSTTAYGKTTPDGVTVSLNQNELTVESGQDTFPVDVLVTSAGAEFAGELIFATLRNFQRVLGLDADRLDGHLEPDYDPDASTLDDDADVDAITVDGSVAVAGTYTVSAPGDGTVTLDDGAGNSQTLEGLVDGAQTLDFSELGITVEVNADFTVNSGAAETYDATTVEVAAPQDEVLAIANDAIGERAPQSYYVRTPGRVKDRDYVITKGRMLVNGDIQLGRDQEVRLPFKIVTLATDDGSNPVEITDKIA